MPQRRKFERENLERNFAYLQQEPHKLTPQFINTLTFPEFNRYFVDNDAQMDVGIATECAKAFHKLTPDQRLELARIKLAQL